MFMPQEDIQKLFFLFSYYHSHMVAKKKPVAKKLLQRNQQPKNQLRSDAAVNAKNNI
jgi:hypothetical protein